MKASYNTTSNKPAEAVHEFEQIDPAVIPAQTYRRILVGTDFSDVSTPAVEQALRLASQNGAELLIAHSCTPPNNLCFMPPESYIGWEDHYRVEVAKKIDALIQRAHQKGVKAHKLLLAGLADSAILEAARRLEVDLIVIGTHDYRGWSRFIKGSISANVVSHAPCAVLMARPSHKA